MTENRQHKIFRPRRNGRSWFIIIAIAVFLHLAFMLFFKTDYLKVFERSDIGRRSASPGSGKKAPGKRGFSFVLLENETEPKEKAPSRVKIEESTSEDYELMLDLPPVELPEIRGIYGRGESGGGSEDGAGGGGIVNPKPLFIPWPDYPEGLDEKYQGQVKLKLYVNEDGVVEEIEIVEGLPSDILNRKAIEAASRIRFSPGRINGKVTSMWIQISIGFQPR